VGVVATLEEVITQLPLEGIRVIDKFLGSGYDCW